MRIGYEAKRIFHNRSGLGNYGRKLIESLAQYFPDNEYLLYNPRRARINFRSPECVREILPPFTNPLYTQLWRQKLLTNRAARDGVDIFHGLSQQIPEGLYKKGIPTVVSVHDVIFLRFPKLYKRMDRTIYTRKLKYACRYADKIVAISEQTRVDLHEYLNVPLDKIEVIYQGCDNAFKRDYSEAELAAIRQKYQLPEDFVLSVGTLERRKNPHLVHQACERLQLPLVMVGRPTRFWRKHLKTTAYPFHHPAVDNTYDLAGLYRLARTFIYPSDFEGFGIPVLEALCSGVPVITSGGSALPEVAGPGSILIRPESSSEMDNALRKVWNSPELRRQMKESGLQFSRHFADEVIASQWQKLYHSLLK